MARHPRHGPRTRGDELGGMVGIVVVAHSFKLAEGIRELADQVAGGKVKIVAAGGLDERTFGTSAERILEGIRRVGGTEGVVILMDMGSAVLSAEMAVEMLPAKERERVRLCPAPLVEGTIAAAVQAALGSLLEDVDAAARGTMRLKKIPDDLDDLALEAGAAPSGPGNAPAGRAQPELVFTVRNRHGLHARPAALFVQAAASFESDINVKNLTRNTDYVNAKSLVQVLGLGVETGHRIALTAKGCDEAKALEELRDLVERGLE